MSNTPEPFASNIFTNISSKQFINKFPFSTLLLLMWLFNIATPSSYAAKFLVLHSDSTWLKYQKYTANFNNWIDLLAGYDWSVLFRNIDSIDFEKKN